VRNVEAAASAVHAYDICNRRLGLGNEEPASVGPVGFSDEDRRR